MKIMLIYSLLICSCCPYVFSQNREERILEVQKSPEPNDTHFPLSISDSSRRFIAVGDNAFINEKVDTVKFTDRILILRTKKEDENP